MLRSIILFSICEATSSNWWRLAEVWVDLSVFWSTVFGLSLLNLWGDKLCSVCGRLAEVWVDLSVFWSTVFDLSLLNLWGDQLQCLWAADWSLSRLSAVFGNSRYSSWVSTDVNCSLRQLCVFLLCLIFSSFYLLTDYRFRFSTLQLITYFSLKYSLVIIEFWFCRTGSALIDISLCGNRELQRRLPLQ